MATKAKAPENDNAPAENTAPIDIGPLSFSDAQEPITSRGGASETTSVFDDVIKESYEQEKLKEFSVPTPAADDQKKKLRSAGNRLNVGLKVRTRENSNGTTTIQFLARDKQWRRSNGSAAPDAPADAPAGDSGAPSDGA